MGLLDQFKAYIDANTPRNTRPAVSPQNVIYAGLLQKPVENIKANAAGLLGEIQRAPQDLAALASPQMYAKALKAMNTQQPVDRQKWIDAGMELSGMAPVGGLLAHTVYHGSPHKFDKFDMSKIGTGEGKQQQGVGLYFAESKDVGQRYADRLADMHGKAEGNLYKVDLPDDAVSKFANYETSFMQQPESVRNAVAPLITDDVMHNLKGYYGWESIDDAPMAAIMGALDISNGNSRAAVTDAFKKSGIPGIRYLDGSSRTAGQGTSNFVLFDDQLPRILEINGQPTGLLSYADEAARKPKPKKAK